MEQVSGSLRPSEALRGTQRPCRGTQRPLNGHSTATQRPLNGHVVGLEMARHRTHLWKDEHVEDEPSLSSSKLLRSRGGVLPAAEDGVEVRVVDGSEVRITGLL